MPRGSDPLPWHELEHVDGVYFTGGDVGAVRAARQAKVLVASARELPVLREAGVELDVLVGSAADAGERYEGGLEPAPRYVVRTEGSSGGTVEPGGRFPPGQIPGPVVDAYGAGDAFAAGLTYGLAGGMPIEEALGLASRCGAAVLAGRGPYEGQLTLVRGSQGLRCGLEWSKVGRSGPTMNGGIRCSSASTSTRSMKRVGLRFRRSSETPSRRVSC